MMISVFDRVENIVEKGENVFCGRPVNLHKILGTYLYSLGEENSIFSILHLGVYFFTEKITLYLICQFWGLQFSSK